MTLPKPKNAEANFREAFEGLKVDAGKLLPMGTPVSQNNVAKEAGCDSTALKKAQFPVLVADIQAYVKNQVGERAPSERQRLLKQRQRSRTAQETIQDLKAQRDAAASLLVESNARISILTRKVRGLETRPEELQSKARTLPRRTTSTCIVPTR
ncbi:hypothetical protein M0765_026000 [Variovorax sp. S2]|uniref:hypothetical protein n=1 Tax=Variovorax sp. S12S4 TaxID=3029170 RepID=UPI00215C8FBD|nr:hypothetical protein [Variovorax sp. S12S4]MCR8961053.1 hypothetical protein [Variovorax sp. S12S4]